MGYKSLAIVVISTILSLGGFVASALYAIKKLKMRFSFGGFDKRLFYEIAGFSFFIFLNMIIDQANWNVDKFLLGMFKGAEMVAVYSVAGQLNLYYITFSTSISNVFAPRVNRLIAANEQKDCIDGLFIRVSRIQFIVMSFVLSGYIIFGKEFIALWAGEGYRTAYYVGLLLMIPVTVSLVQTLAIEIQRARNMHRFRSVVYAVIAVFNILASIPLSKRYGAVGAAAGTAVAMTIGNIFIMNIFYHKKLGLDMVRFWKEMASFIPALAVPVAVGAVIKMYADAGSVASFVVYVLLYCAVFIASMWAFGMNGDEKNLILSPVLKLTKRK